MANLKRLLALSVLIGLMTASGCYEKSKPESPPEPEPEIIWSDYPSQPTPDVAWESGWVLQSKRRYLGDER